MFGYAVKKGYVIGNPAEKVDRPLLDERAVGILTPDQARKLLNASQKCFPEMTPAIAIGLFARLLRIETGNLGIAYPQE